MHTISHHSVSLAIEHSFLTQQHGESVVALGKSLQGSDNQRSQEYGQLIEEYGQQIQHYAQESLLFIVLLLIYQQNSVQLYVKVQKLHIKAAMAYSTAMIMYTQEIWQGMERLKRD